MRLFVVALLTSIVSITTFAQAGPVDKVDSPILVELFTSQSCSSCPPADKLLGQIAQNDNVIALSCHVTYWNHLHWKDTLSQEFCTARQREYSRAMKKRGPYTPQMIVNGTHDVVGNRRGQVSKLIKEVSKMEALIPIKISQNDNILQIEIPHADRVSKTSSVLLFTYQNQHKQVISNGENAGKIVHYTNPVKNITALGTWDGTARTFTYTLPSTTGGYAAIIQEKNYGKIIGAGKLEL